MSDYRPFGNLSLLQALSRTYGAQNGNGASTGNSLALAQWLKGLIHVVRKPPYFNPMGTGYPPMDTGYPPMGYPPSLTPTGYPPSPYTPYNIPTPDGAPYNPYAPPPSPGMQGPNGNNFANQVYNETKAIAERVMNQIAQMNLQSVKDTMPLVIEQTKIANENNKMSAEAQIATARMANQHLGAHIGIQLASLAQKQGYTLMMDVQEQFLYTEMVREKMYNLFADLEKSRFDNAFQRSKTLVQSMKY